MKNCDERGFALRNVLNSFTVTVLMLYLLLCIQCMTSVMCWETTERNHTLHASYEKSSMKHPKYTLIMTSLDTAKPM